MEPKGKSDPPDVQRLQNEVDRMFLELLRGERVPRYSKAAFRPNADVYFDKREKVFVVKIELPGTDRQEISLEAQDNLLRVSGVRSDECHPDAVYQQMEITYGRFERTVRLPPEADTAKARADYGGGFLRIIVPLKPRPAGRRIPIIVKDENEEERQS